MPIPGFAQARLASNGIRLNVWHGGGDGPAVVLLHGWCGSSHTWRMLAPLLADAGHLVIAPDVRGYGDSDKPEGGYDAANGAADVAGVLDALGVTRAHIVGHDMGAPIALLFADRYPARTLTAAWLDKPLLGFDTERYTAFTDWNHGGYWQFGFNATPGLAELMYAGREEAFLTLIYGLMTVNKAAVTPADVAEQARGLKMPGGIAGWVGWYRAALETGAQMRAAAARGGVKAPFLAVRGDGGVAGILDEIKRALPHARGEVLARCGHLVAEERPAELAALLTGHFAYADGAAS